MTECERKEYILSLSYGKDSLACLGAIERLKWPLDRIVHAEVWATDTISADLPPMVEFKKKADSIIKSRYGIEVEHVCAHASSDERSTLLQKQTYEKLFYRIPNRRSIRTLDEQGLITGFPYPQAPWCNSGLKRRALRQCFPQGPLAQGASTNIVQYLGIAADEPARLKRLDGVTKTSPLAAIGWAETDTRKWCEENDLLSPIYTTSTRGGCWFCHNQSLDQLRVLRRNYPDLWALLLKWDEDSPVTFRPDGHTVHDLDRRFQLEDNGKIPTDKRFRWSMLDKYAKEG